METKYADMGNSIREKHKERRGDFVMFADDDNWCAGTHTGNSFICKAFFMHRAWLPVILVCNA